MKKLLDDAVLWMMAAVVAVPMILWGCMTGCSPALNKQIAKSAIDVALAACIFENAFMDEPALKEACKYADELAPAVKDLLAAQKRGVAKAAAYRANAGAARPADAGKD